MQEHNLPSGDIQRGNEDTHKLDEFENNAGCNQRLTPKKISEHISQFATIGQTEVTGESLLLSDFKQVPSLIDPFLQRSGLACLAGSSDTGKSSLLRQLAIAIVSGEQNFLGFPINAQHNSVIFVSTEDLQRETSVMLSKQAKGVSPEQLRSLRFVFDFEGLERELDRRLSNIPADLVIIDCFADVFGKDLKDTQQIRTFLNGFQKLALKHDCIFLFLHHTGKRTENVEPSKNNLLSGQGFEAKMRLVIELRADLVDPLKRHFCIVKGNYLPAKFKKESFVLKFDEENFVFENTNERMPFEFLVKQTEPDQGKEKFQTAKVLKQSGMTYEQIAERLGYGSRGSVSKLFDKAKKLGWETTVSEGNVGIAPFPVSEHLTQGNRKRTKPRNF